MKSITSPLPRWLLVVSGLLALLELAVSILLWTSPQSFLDSVDLKNQEVQYLVYMWASRQLAIAFILGYATIKRSQPMLVIAYISLVIMFAGDLLIGILQNNNALILGATVMLTGCSTLLYLVAKKRNQAM